MSSLIKAVKNGSSNLFGRQKHKKLPEQWDGSIKEPVIDGITFYVKYLGSTLVNEPNDQHATAGAIKTIITMAKNSGRKLPRVALAVNPKGILTTDLSTGEKHLDFSIYRISFCSADSNYERVVAFIGTNLNETLECHAFLCSKCKVAQAVALTISQAFSIAFELWERAREESRDDNVNISRREKEEVNSNTVEETDNLIDLDMDSQSATLTMEKLGIENNQKLDRFVRLSSSRNPPMFVHGMNSQELTDICHFMNSNRNAFFDDHIDDLLAF